MERYQSNRYAFMERASDLLSRMTLREKIGQLTQRLYGFAVYERHGEEIVLTEEFRQEVERFGGIGALYGLYRADPWSGKDFSTGLDGVLAPRTRNQVQRYVLEHSRLGIPVLMSTECPHGHQALDGYLLPVNLAAAASWSPELLERAAGIAGRQLREMGVDLALVSCLDILRDPRWGRSEECFGEDPFLAARMTQAVIRGIQSADVDVVAKHLCAQGETTGGVNASAARIGWREVREIHLPAVKAAVDAEVAAFMAAYNEIDGVYCHANPMLLQNILRGEYRFDGFVMSDGVAIDQLDAVTGDRVASGALALNSGVDMGLWDTAFGQLEEAVKRGLVDEKRIDEAAYHILELKFRRGLFDEPFVPETDQWRGYTPENYPQVKRLAEESIVLLRNSGNLLPLDGRKPLRVLLTGPNADDLYCQLGDYTPPVRPESGVTVRQGLERWIQANGSPVKLTCCPGCPRFAAGPGQLAQAEQLAQDADVIVAVLGGSSSRFGGGEFLDNGALASQKNMTMDCGENVDAALLRLPGGQLCLLNALKKCGKPVVTVLIQGRPYEMAEIDEQSDAILCCFYPGLTGGEAVAKVLFGEIAPAGRLPVSLPDHTGQLPVYYNYKDSYQGGRYYDVTRPTYPFGSGLTYTSFAYTLEDAPSRSDNGEGLAVTATVRNTGGRAAYAVPQLYLHRAQGVVTSRVRALCAFEKVWLEPGEEKSVRLEIPQDSLRQWDAKMRHVLPPGRIEWFVCDGGESALEIHLSGAFEIAAGTAEA
ncbi:MAG: glycoside hydrolase family 3 C-terminal domain-containing protein [Oscillospiraceae bacterium]|nr:glycoside hydrolase family 3 C-terminal domain-containing protein [Oscillospiraceae bacterium]